MPILMAFIWISLMGLNTLNRVEISWVAGLLSLVEWADCAVARVCFLMDPFRRIFDATSGSIFLVEDQVFFLSFAAGRLSLF